MILTAWLVPSGIGDGSSSDPTRRRLSGRLIVSVNTWQKRSCAGHREFGQGAPDETGEFEAVAAARAGHDHLGPAGPGGDDEVLPGGNRIQAGLGPGQGGVGQGGDVPAEEIADQPDIRRLDLPVLDL